MPDLDRRLAALAEAGDFAGAVVIRQHGRLIYQRGFGLADPAAGIGFSPETVVETGSVTKPVTAAAVLLLVSERRLDLGTPVRALIPDYPHEATTIRDLLIHSGGLPDYSAFEAELTSGRVIRTQDLIGLIAGRHGRPEFAPGSRFAYCNICHDTLALIVEAVTGQSYESFVRDRFLAPAGAGNVFLRPARFGEWSGVRIRGYRRTPGGIEPNDVFDNEGFYGGGNLYFSAADLAAWMSAWANRHASVRSIAAAALAPVRFPGGRSGLTLGNWYCASSRTRCYYPGHHQGFHAFGYWDSDRRSAIAFVSNGTLSPQLQVEIPRLLIAAAEGRQLPWPATQDAFGAGEVQPGTYQVGGIGRVVISRTQDGLSVVLPEFTAYRLVPAGDGWLYAPGLDAYLAVDDGRGALRWSSIFVEAQGRRLE